MKYKPLTDINRDDIKKIESLLTNNNSIITGSYRRMKPFCKDIDVVTLDMDSYINYLIKKLPKDCIHIYAKGINKASMLIKPNKDFYKLDVFQATEDQKYTMILYSTGSKQFNIKSRSIARKQGYLLNQFGLFFKNKKLIIKSERDIFNILKIPYVEPKNR